jgi:tRNA threonylcarbamoyladenosine biosynthesis protein TsaE
LIHLDWYRIADEDELEELGLDEYFARPGIALVEWADRFPAALPRERLEIRIEVVDATTRRFEISGTSPSTQAIADRVTIVR